MLLSARTTFGRMFESLTAQGSKRLLCTLGRGIHCLKVTLAEPETWRVPYHVGAQNQLNDAAPDVLPSIASAHSKELRLTGTTTEGLGPGYHQARPAVWDRARM